MYESGSADCLLLIDKDDANNKSEWAPLRLRVRKRKFGATGSTELRQPQRSYLRFQLGSLFGFEGCLSQTHDLAYVRRVVQRTSLSPLTCLGVSQKRTTVPIVGGRTRLDRPGDCSSMCFELFSPDPCPCKTKPISQP
jgi:hypothetical protein